MGLHVCALEHACMGLGACMCLCVGVWVVMVGVCMCVTQTLGCEALEIQHLIFYLIYNNIFLPLFFKFI